MAFRCRGVHWKDEVLRVGRADLFAAPGQVEEGRVVEHQVGGYTAFLRERPSGDEVEDLETEPVEAVGQGRIVLPWRNALQVAQVEIGAQVEVRQTVSARPRSGGWASRPERSPSVAFLYLPLTGLHGLFGFLDARADLVQLYTGFIYEGPSLVKRIKKAILKR